MMTKRGASTIRDFCKRNTISVPSFYRMPLKPHVTKIGARSIIFDDDEDAWREEMRKSGENAD
jgi:hypothetical protein